MSGIETRRDERASFGNEASARAQAFAGGRNSPDDALGGLEAIVRFREERRTSIRVPLAGLVKVGPPREAPEALVQARDVSVGGLFIDADRPVRVGARFSAAVPLALGGEVYIAEAEVAYNRIGASGPGFGVRFVEIDEASRVLLVAEIDALRKMSGTTGPIGRARNGTRDSEGARSDIDRGLDGDRFVPSDVAFPVDLEDGSDAGLLAESLGSFGPSSRPAFDPRLDPRSGSGPKGNAASSASRRRTRFLRGLAVVSVSSIIVIVALVLWEGARSNGRESTEDPSARGVSASTHQALMGEKIVDPLDLPPSIGTDESEAASSAAAEPDPTSTPAEAKRPLPPLVVLDDVEDRVSDSSAAPPARESAPPLGNPEGAELEGPANGRRPGPQAAPPSRAQAAHESPSAVPPRAAPPKERPKERAHGSSSARYDLRVSSAATVLRTHVLRRPDRFVVDLAGHAGDMQIPSTSSPHIKAVRVGRHPGFVRIVFDAQSSLRQGRASKQGDRLLVTLDFGP